MSSFYVYTSFANGQNIKQLSSKTIEHRGVVCYITNILNSDGHEYIICNSVGWSSDVPGAGGTFMLHSFGCKKCNEKTDAKPISKPALKENPNKSETIVVNGKTYILTEIDKSK
jgi:hypothetical protein